MFTRPDDLPDSALLDVLRSGWALQPSSMEYLAVGFGSHHWRAQVDGGARFVTVDDLTTRVQSAGESPDDVLWRLRAALVTARASYENGATFVVAPIATVDGDVLRRFAERYAAAVYPYVDGRRYAFSDELEASERRSILRLLVALHATPDGIRSDAGVDDFRIPMHAELVRALDRPESRWDTGPYGERARLLLTSRARNVERLLGHHERLAAQARGRPERMVLTHGEPHPGNLIETDAGWRLVDWDTALVAPPERDLWILEPGDGSITSAYEAATGRAVLPSALELYRLTWQLADISLFAEQLRQPHEDTEDVRTAWTALQQNLP